MRNTGTNYVCCLCYYEGGKWWQNYFDLLREPFLELISCNMFPHSFDNRCVKILNWKVIDGNAPSASVRDMSTMAENRSINHESGKEVSNPQYMCAQPCIPYTLTLKRHCPLHAPSNRSDISIRSMLRLSHGNDQWSALIISCCFLHMHSQGLSIQKRLLTGKHAGFNLNKFPVFKQPLWGITRSQK